MKPPFRWRVTSFIIGIVLTIVMFCLLNYTSISKGFTLISYLVALSIVFLLPWTYDWRKHKENGEAKTE